MAEQVGIDTMDRPEFSFAMVVVQPRMAVAMLSLLVALGFLVFKR